MSNAKDDKINRLDFMNRSGIALNRARITMVTPPMASKILEVANGNNYRPLDMARVRLYARAMQLGHWISENGATIVIGEDGSVIDGQHRLRAVVESGMTIGLVFHGGAPAGSNRTIDVGKVRAPSLQFRDIPNSRMAAAVTGMVWRYASETLGHRSASTLPPGELRDLCNPVMQEAIAQAKSITNLIPTPSPAAMGAVLYLGMLSAATGGPGLGEFGEQYRTGANLGEFAAANQLKGWCMRAYASQRRPDSITVFAITIKAANDHASNNNRRKLLRWASDEKFPFLEIMPPSRMRESTEKLGHYWPIMGA